MYDQLSQCTNIVQETTPERYNSVAGTFSAETHFKRYALLKPGVPYSMTGGYFQNNFCINFTYQEEVYIFSPEAACYLTAQQPTNTQQRGGPGKNSPLSVITADSHNFNFSPRASPNFTTFNYGTRPKNNNYTKNTRKFK